MLTGSLILNRLGHHHYLTQICFEALQIFLKMEKEAPGLKFVKALHLLSKKLLQKDDENQALKP